MPKSDAPQVIAINYIERKALLDNDELIEIHTWYDDEGYQTPDPHTAAACVAGDEEHGWYAIDIQLFETAIMN